jgi:hypothetical protein
LITNNSIVRPNKSALRIRPVWWFLGNHSFPANFERTEDKLAFTRRQDKKTAAQTQMTVRSYLNRQQHILVVHFLIVLIVLSRQKHSSKFDSFAALILRRLGQWRDPLRPRTPSWSSNSAILIDQKCQIKSETFRKLWLKVAA